VTPTVDSESVKPGSSAPHGFRAPRFVGFRGLKTSVKLVVKLVKLMVKLEGKGTGIMISWKAILEQIN
jgi:hypothetical protein